MTFGRSPNDRTNPTALGTTPAGPDSPYGQLADGFGGHGPAPDGFGGAPRAPVQFDLATDRAGGDASRAHDIADAATAGAGHDLPHLDTIQQAFGPHDVSGVRAHTDDAAARGSAQLGAHAFASGNDVAFATPSPDLHTAAHEAAHVVQQRAGVQLKDGLGQVGDTHEQHADAVADAVVRGESAAELLGPASRGSSASVQRRAIQRDAATPEELTTSASMMLGVDDEVRELISATTAIMRDKGRAEGVRAELKAGLPPAAAAAKLLAIVDHVIPGLASFAVAKQRYDELATSPAAVAPLTRRDTEAKVAPIRQALATNLPFVVDALNNIALVGLEIEAAPVTPSMLEPPPGPISSLNPGLARLANAGRPLGWQLPANPAEANERRHAYDACPPGANNENPEGCHLSEPERVGLRSEVYRALDRVADNFTKACEPEARALAQIVARETAHDDFLASTLFDTIFGVAKTIAPSGLIASWLFDFGKSMRRGKLKPPTDAALADQQSGLAALEASVHQILRDLGDHIRTIDDDGLRTVQLIAQQLTPGKFAPQVHSFVARYKEQIAPLGHMEDIPGRGTTRFADKQVAVWIQLDPVHKRLARVGHVHDTTYIPFQGPRDEHIYRFVTWIDDDLQTAAGADAAPIIEATQVANVPLAAIMRSERGR